VKADQNQCRADWYLAVGAMLASRGSAGACVAFALNRNDEIGGLQLTLVRWRDNGPSVFNDADRAGLRQKHELGAIGKSKAPEASMHSNQGWRQRFVEPVW
jgi:hypothetical protein